MGYPKGALRLFSYPATLLEKSFIRSVELKILKVATLSITKKGL
jgi:hypothetical protein